MKGYINTAMIHTTCSRIMGLVLVYALSCWTAKSLWATLAAPHIAIIPADGNNLQIAAQPAADQLLVKLSTPTHNWFAGTLINLPLDHPVTIDLPMNGNNTRGNAANVKKWVGLQPVMTYADPTQYASYECFHKDHAGRWVSTDPLKRGEERFAGIGALPEQQAMPAELAGAFLAQDGATWTPWREVDTVQVDVTANSLRLQQRFAAPAATIAMRVPFTYTFLQAFITRLQAVKLPGVFLDELGNTPGGRKLQVIRVEDAGAASEPATHRTLLVIAREHATEQASSWVAFGALEQLLAETPEAAALRKNTTWLFVPIEDPDGSADAVFDRLTDLFAYGNAPDAPPEEVAYATYFANYIYAGKTIDLSVSLHNVEANESAHICCPYGDLRHLPEVAAANGHIFRLLHEQDFQIDPSKQPWEKGMQTFRLYFWCADHYNALDLAFEVNDRYPAQRLDLNELRRFGAGFGQGLARWRDSQDGKKWHQVAVKSIAEITQKRAAFYQRAGYGPEKRSIYDLVVHGY